MSSETLPPKLSAYCQTKWDASTQKFVQNEPHDIISCCLASCGKTVDECYKLCPPGPGECKDRCDSVLSSCANSCYEHKSPGLEALRVCATNVGCGMFPTVDASCLRSRKTEVLSCCHSKTNNDDECNTVYNGIVYPLPLRVIESTTQGSTKSRYGFGLIFVIICVIVGLVTAYMVYVK